MATNRRTPRKRRREHGGALAEFAVSLPVLLVAFLGTVDMARIVYRHQILADLSRETANLVSRGTTIDAAIKTVVKTSDYFDVDSDGVVIISRVRARDKDDDTPWVVDQQSNGALEGMRSKVGKKGGPATLPATDTMRNGMQIMTVELVQQFVPLFPAERLGVNFYPKTIRTTAYF